VDSVYSHLAWQANIEQNFGIQIPFPVIADLDQKVSRLYGMVPPNATATTTVRTVFFIDDQGVVRALIYYPLSLGRNISEILRVVDALQFNAKEALATPADWTPGQPAVIPAPTTATGMRERLETPNQNQKAWYYKTTG
jgi:peroxiredoxin (alkyl hydroperoxide reductase subunit C)